MSEHRERIVEGQVEARLRTHGAVLIAGAKAVGKTTTARGFAASEVRLDRDRASLTAAQTDPSLVLDGEYPRLIDEYQLVEGMWNAVRGRVDDLGEKGLFLLTGSSTPEDEQASHTGARRIAPVTMRTMTLLERGLSSGAVSVGALLDGVPARSEPHDFGVAEAIEALAIGGWPDNLGLTAADALDANADYIDVIVNADVRRVDGVKRDPDGVRRLLASYARNVATDASLRTIGRAAEAPLSEVTLHDYLRTLRRLFLIEDQESWKPGLRSRVRLAATPKRHLADPSLAVAAMGATPQRLLGPEIELAGLLFESQAVHDLRVYAQPHRGAVRFYRDNKGLEVDAIVEAVDGRWIAVEVKLGHHWVDEGARSLLALRRKLSAETNAACGALVVIVADSPTYTRPDGVVVTSIASLGP
jgi:predicted AAA+ superfamily ATPase